MAQTLAGKRGPRGQQEYTRQAPTLLNMSSPLNARRNAGCLCGKPQPTNGRAAVQADCAAAARRLLGRGPRWKVRTYCALAVQHYVCSAQALTSLTGAHRIYPWDTYR